MTEGEIDRLEARADFVEDEVLAAEMREHAAQLRAAMKAASSPVPQLDEEKL